MRRLEQLLADGEAELALIGRNLARARDEAESDMIRAVWLKQKFQTERCRQNVVEAQSRRVRQEEADAAAQVELALSLYDELQSVVKENGVKSAIAGFLEKINLRPWLSFGEGTKRTRKIRVL